MEYQNGDLVVYGIHGVCRIIGREIRAVDRKQIEYYVLEPQDQPGARYFIPTQNQAAVSKLRSLLSSQEISNILQAQNGKADAWIQDENLRKQRYRELINSGDRAALISMVHALHLHKQEQTAAGKKFHLCDENFMRDAQKLLGTEFSLVLNIPQEQVAQYVMDMMKTE